MTGPYETEQQVRELPAVRVIYDAMHASHRRGVMGELGCRLVDEACEAASVKVGAYDHRILTWLAGFEPETCAVVAGLITRAHQAGTAVTGEHPVTLTAAQAAAVRRALADAEVYRRQRAAVRCADCESSPAGKCTDHMDDLDAADAYRDLASGLTYVRPEPPREAVIRDAHSRREGPDARIRAPGDERADHGGHRACPRPVQNGGTGCCWRRPIARTSTCGGFRTACGPASGPFLTWGSRRWLTSVVVGCARTCDGPETAQRAIGWQP